MAKQAARIGGAKTKPKSTDDTDVRLGQRLRELRTLRGISRDELAKRTEVAAQQIEKYENGKNRISASRLLKFATLLNVSVGSFYEGVGGKGGGRRMHHMGLEIAPGSASDLEVVHLLSHFANIADTARRRTVIDFAKFMSQQ